MQEKNDNFFIYEVDSKYNYDLFPLTINDDEIVKTKIDVYGDCRFERSQYSLEITLHDLFKKHNKLTNDYDKSNIVFIPIYLFLSAWKTNYFYSVEDVKNDLNEIKPIIEKIQKDGKKVILVYSDVMWEDERCFINHFDFGENVYFVCYESVSSPNKQIPVPYCTHIKCKPSGYKIPFNPNKKHLISYAGRERKELKYFNNLEILDTSKKCDKNHWISLNNKEFYNKIDNLYLNSYFSLQPHGDKQSRKGFYHSLLLGCIPVIFEDNYTVYNNIFRNIVNVSDISIVLNHSENGDYEKILEKELENIESKIFNIEKIKNLLLYDESDLSIVDYILNKVINNNQ
jgi:hypothetical protein